MLGGVENCEGRCIYGIVSAEVKDGDGGIMLQNELYDSLQGMLKRGRAPISLRHTSKTVGDWTEFRKDTIEIKGKQVPIIYGIGKLDTDTELSTDTWNQIKSGELLGLSIRGIGDTKYSMIDNKITPIFINNEAYEVSLVDNPSVPLAYIKQINEHIKSKLDDNKNNINTNSCNNNSIMPENVTPPPTENEQVKSDNELVKSLQEQIKELQTEMEKMKNHKKMEDEEEKDDDKDKDDDKPDEEEKDDDKDKADEPKNDDKDKDKEQTKQLLEELKTEMKKSATEINEKIDKMKQEHVKGVTWNFSGNVNDNSNKMTEFLKSGKLQPHPALLKLREMIKSDSNKGKNVFNSWVRSLLNGEFTSDNIQDVTINWLKNPTVYGGGRIPQMANSEVQI